MHAVVTVSDRLTVSRSDSDRSRSGSRSGSGWVRHTPMQCPNKFVKEWSLLLGFVETLPPLTYWQRFMENVSDSVTQSRCDDYFTLVPSATHRGLYDVCLKHGVQPATDFTMPYVGVLLKASEWDRCPTACYTGTNLRRPLSHVAAHSDQHIHLL
jgi:hypothetical protein